MRPQRFGRGPAGLMTATALVGLAPAQSVDWGTSLSLLPVGYHSDGTATGSRLIWTLGYFRDGFVPDQTNHPAWAAHYVEVDSTVETSEPFFGVSGSKSDVGPEAAGKQAWILAYNDLCLLGSSVGEALLFKQDGLLFPGFAESRVFDIADNPFDADDDGFTVVWGRVDRNRDALGGLVTGGGTLGSPLADTSSREWEGQTASWASPPQTPYQIAVSTVSDPGLRGRDQDADGDGMTNLREHAAGTSLTTPDSGYVMVSFASADSLRLTLPANRPSDVRYLLESSADLEGGWEEWTRADGGGPWQGAQPVSITPASGSREIIEFEPPSGIRRFFRLRMILLCP